MAYVTPGTVAAGDVATAAAWNVITNDVIQIGGLAQGVFTNEAARDAAITSPTEGMIAYLTAATVPAATGSITAVPTGVRTIYNGSVWVCVTEVGARSEVLGANTASTSFVSTLTLDTTPISVTLVTGTTAVVSIHFTGFTQGFTAVMAVAVSGASTIAATEAKGIVHNDLTNASAVQSSHGSTFVFTGLTAGTNTFTAQYKISSGTATFNNARALTVKGIA